MGVEETTLSVVRPLGRARRGKLVVDRGDSPDDGHVIRGACIFSSEKCGWDITLWYGGSENIVCVCIQVLRLP